MTPPILARVAQLHGSSEDADCDTISSATSWEYVSKSSSLSDLTRFGAAFSSSSTSNNHNSVRPQEIAQPSVFSSSSHLQSNHHHYNSRALLPHGIVPLPPPHRNTHHNGNGFHGYRLTQKDLLQPQQSTAALSSEKSNGITVTPPVFSARDTTFNSKDESNPVMRSTSFNLDCGAARKYTYRFRQTSQNTPACPGGPVRKDPSNLNKPQQRAIVFVAENPENGACDVYNVPFQSDIYSLPVDSIASATSAGVGGGKKVGRSNSICTSKVISTAATASFTQTVNITPPAPIVPPTTATKASSSVISHQNSNQNQRLKSSEPPLPSLTPISPPAPNNCNTSIGNGGGTPPPPQRKNNLNRRRSREDGGSSILESCNIKCPPPPPPQPPAATQKLQEPTGSLASCKPPQRWSSLSVQPSSSSSSSPPKPGIPVCSEPPIITPVAQKQSGALQSITNNVSKQLPPLPPPPHHSNVPSYSASNALIESNNKVENVEKTTNHFSVSKKPRSRSVDPAADKLTGTQRQSGKLSAVSSTNANHRISTNNLNYIDNDNPNNHPLPPEPVEAASNKESSHSTTADRRNPLGLSFLNLFRRNKNGGAIGGGGGGCSSTSAGSGGSKQQNTQRNNKVLEDNSHSESEFLSLVPTSSEDENHAGAGNVDGGNNSNSVMVNLNNNKEDTSYYFRELPPPPPGEHSDDSGSDGHGSPPATSPLECRDFAASIERVKDCGWYWGPLSSEAAEDLLKNEPDGSFIVRDSSDARYIFSLTFKLHGLVRHVRIEHDQGNFSFGPLTRFKAATIVDFVEKAVAHSRSGRYLFFLHRRPVLGPMQVQLLHPYSRFMHPRSLKHMCRFVILKYVRRDLIHTLPLPKPLQDYLNTPHYYFEPPDRVSGVGGSSCSAVNEGGVASNNIRNGGHHHPPHQSAATIHRVV